MAKNTDLTSRLRQFFGWQKSSNTFSGAEPVKRTGDPNLSKFNKKEFPTKIKDLWNWYLGETADTSSTLRNRKERYEDIDYMIYNDSIISMSLDLYADEVSQPDTNMEIIKVNAPDAKVAKAVREFLTKLGVTQKYIRQTAYNLCGYGDSFDVVNIDPKEGVTSLTAVDVYDVTDRLEFKASEIRKRRDFNQWYSLCRDYSVRQYISKAEDEIKNNDSPSAAFESYLFGFILCEEYYLSPWQVLHYRLDSSRSEFFPFGRPLFINLIGPWRQLKTSMNLLALARTLKFPKDIFSVDTSEEMTSMEKWEAVNEAREEYSNQGRYNTTKEEFGLADEVWIPKDLIDFQTHQTDISLDDIADVELLRDNIMMGTRVPKGYLIVDEGWGTSNQSLLQQSKPFGRAVFWIQSTILETLSYLCKLHFLITGQFDKEFTEFELSMNFPVVEEASDRLQLKSDSMDLAKAIIDNLKDAMGYTADTIPVSLVKSVFSKYSFLSPQELDLFISELEKEQKKADASGDTYDPNDLLNNGGFRGNNEVDFHTEQTQTEKFMSRLSEEAVKTAYFDSLKKLGITEATINRRHVYVSREDKMSTQEKKVFSMVREVAKIRENFKESK